MAEDELKDSALVQQGNGKDISSAWLELKTLNIHPMVLDQIFLLLKWLQEMVILKCQSNRINVWRSIYTFFIEYSYRISISCYSQRYSKSTVKVS